MFFQDSIQIESSPAKVWKTLIEERRFYKTNVTFTLGKETYILDQEFSTPLGPAKCSFLIHEQKYGRMDFNLIESPVLKELSGYWLLEDNKVGWTKLSLNIDTLKPKLPIPAIAIKKVMKGIVRNRLERIKISSELQFD